MIKITNQENVKKKGDFSLDRMWIKEFRFENPALENNPAPKLIIELVPFAYLEDGTAIFDHSNTKKVYLSNVFEYMETSEDTSFASAYLAVESAVAAMIGAQNPTWDCVFEMPEGV